MLSTLGRLSAVAGEGLLVEEVCADEEGGGSEERDQHKQPDGSVLVLAPAAYSGQQFVIDPTLRFCLLVHFK